MLLLLHKVRLIGAQANEQDLEQAMYEDIKLIKRLDDMRARHRDLDDQIKALAASPLNQLLVARLKKEKLTLRDEINQLERIVYPDIIA